MDQNHVEPAHSQEQILDAQFQREELWPLIERASCLARSVPNPRWARAYADLAQAASTVDAFIARGAIQTTGGSPS